MDMNFTRIDNIKDKVKDWNQVGVEYLTKVFEFSSFEQGQAFVKNVS
jgi:pterin-4a-carbinolamine dehydratase